jgi:hypothetical protein
VQRQMKQAGTKVGADELPAVTQLFTEQYMVAFQLENALGAWMHSRHPRMAVPVEMPYFPHHGRWLCPPRARFPAWPDSLAQLHAAGPLPGFGPLPGHPRFTTWCRCGALPKSCACATRWTACWRTTCMAWSWMPGAWKLPPSRWPWRPGATRMRRASALGYRPLPRLNIACVGCCAPRSKKGRTGSSWPKATRRLEGGMAALYDLFQKAPELGSLIDPMAATRGDLIECAVGRAGR